MNRLFAALALVAALAAGTGLAIAQREKPADPKKPADPVKADPKAGKGTVTIKPDAKGRYRLLVKDADGKALLMTAGNGFETEKEARDAIAAAKEILTSGKVTVEKADEKGKEE